MRCPGCGFENPEGMNFCGKYALMLSPRCPQCGFENPPDFAFCGKCATSLHLQQGLQFHKEDSPQVKLEKLENTLSQYRFPKDAKALLEELS